MSEADARITTHEVAGNRLTLLADGPERLEALIALIDGAQESLRILYYIWEDDESGRRVRDALLAARERGIEVSLLVDGFGAVSAPFFKPLVDADARLCRFVSRWGRRYLLRNHQKLALADGTKAIVGGFNISNDYFGTIADGAWRDLGLEIEGPSVGCLVDYFEAIFRWAETEDASIRSLRRTLFQSSVNEGQIHWLFGGPTRRLSPWARSVKNDLMNARRVDMISAYFAPSLSMIRRLIGVAKRGRLRLITPAKLDHQFLVGAARFLYWRLLRRGAEIYEYQATKLHTKLVVLDDVVHIGSANFDLRSLYLNLEMMLRVDDAAFAAAMHRFVDGEIACSQRITAEAHRANMTWWNRMQWALGYFLVATADYNLSWRLNVQRRVSFGRRKAA
ncbi:MAG TPA: phosphatidylserine/phosphatidylglycerophosphate/cardiolipin synthase family protein [Allosphingosinicella sp.]|nr:phosphatidylserine/phosphatidylglycerophosphate/cardiolipin synthase family protein [Allosphingosinicella sp.]